MSNTADLNDNDGLRAAAAALRSSGWLRLATIVEQHIAEVSDLRQTLDATEKERDQWHDAALDRRQALHDADALRTGVHLALSPEGGANGWRPSRGVDALIDLALTVREDADRHADSGWGYRASLSLDDIRCDVLDTGWPLGDDTDPERTPRRLVREVLAELAHVRDQRDNLQAACDRLRANADARERFLRREGDRLRAVERDAEDAEKGARACDQIVALLDGIPVEAPCPEAARVAALLAEVERLRADLDALSRAVGQALVAASLAAGETLADPIPHIIVSTVTRLRAEALGQRAEASFLRACVPPVHPTDYGHEAWTEALRAAVYAERAGVVAWLRVWQGHMDDRITHDDADYAIRVIERGEHRREEAE